MLEVFMSGPITAKEEAPLQTVPPLLRASERILRKDYDRKGSVEKISDRESQGA
jgi:hypothetical protein